MKKPRLTFIGLGSNLGNRKRYIENAVSMLDETRQINLVRTSAVIETAPLGEASQPEYLNTVAEIETSLSAEQLFRKMHEIETALDRARPEKWTSRTIDLDLLLYGDEVINTSELAVPHPQMHLRSFVLNGISELNSEIIHPVLKVTIAHLQRRLNGNDFVLNAECPQLVSIAGIIGVGKTTLAKKLGNLSGCKVLFEPYAENPFLSAVYDGQKQYSLASQIYFLISRTEQLNLELLENGKIAITDYVFDKEFIYAEHLLDAEQLALYEKTNKQLAAQIAKPVLVLFLQDSVRNCLQRIHKRNRPYEQKIETKFLEVLDADYRRLFADWKACPVIRISMSDFDCNKDSDVKYLLNQIKNYVVV